MGTQKLNLTEVSHTQFQIEMLFQQLLHYFSQYYAGGDRLTREMSLIKRVLPVKKHLVHYTVG